MFTKPATPFWYLDSAKYLLKCLCFFRTLRQKDPFVGTSNSNSNNKTCACIWFYLEGTFSFWCSIAWKKNTSRPPKWFSTVAVFPGCPLGRSPHQDFMIPSTSSGDSSGKRLEWCFKWWYLNIAGEIKQCKVYGKNLRDFPYNRALFGLIMTPV